MNEKPFLSLCMIVKNEEKHLPRCLDSVKDVVDEMIIVDTGSTDRTKEIALSYGAKVYDFEWIDDFAAARNFSLEKATGEWILVLDADEELEEQTAKSLRSVLRNTQVDAIVFLREDKLDGQMYADSDLAALLRAFRNRGGYRYQRRYHEEIDPAIENAGGKIEICYDFMILHHGTKSQIVQGDTKRFERAIHILQNAIEEDPSDFSLYICLGLEYYNAKDYKNSKQIILSALESIQRFDPKKIRIGSIHEAYTILGYIALYEHDVNNAKFYAQKAMGIFHTYSEYLQVSPSRFFTYRHSLSLLGLTLMEEAYQMALVGQYLPSLQNATEARKIFLELRSYPNQSQNSRERIDRLLTYCDKLISTLQKG